VANVVVQQVDFGVVFALSQESGCFVDMLSRVRITRGDGFIARRGRCRERDVVVVESGPGRQRAAKAAHAMIDAYRPRMVVSSGFAGGLDPSVKRYDLVAAETLVAADGREIALDPAALNKATTLPSLGDVHSLHRGRLLTTDRIIRLSDEKRRLGAQHQALAVDMESFAVAEVCQARAVPILVVRAISDAVNDELPPDIGRLLSRKTFAGQLGAAVGSVFRRPGAVKDLFHLHQAALECSARLAKFLAAFCTHHAPP
jgi:adenosylhomocysteine nucleosidase